MWDNKVAQWGKIFSAMPDNLNSIHWIHIVDGEICCPLPLHMHCGKCEATIIHINSENVNNNKIVVKTF